MDDDELKAIEDRCNAATPGPWYEDYEQDGEFIPDGQGGALPGSYAGDHYPNGEVFSVIDDNTFDVFAARHREDVEFLRNARTDIPALIAEVRRLRDLLVMSNVDPWEEK